MLTKAPPRQSIQAVGVCPLQSWHMQRQERDSVQQNPQVLKVQKAENIQVIKNNAQALFLITGSVPSLLPLSIICRFWVLITSNEMNSVPQG